MNESDINLKANFEALINSSDDLIWSVSRDFKLIAGNKAFIKGIEAMAGVTLRCGDNLLIHDIFTTNNFSFWKDAYNKTFSGESFKIEIYSPVVNNWKASWAEISFNPIFKDDAIIAIACYARNITEGKLAQEKLKESEARLAEAQAISKVGSWETNLLTFEVIWSKETRRIFGTQNGDETISHQKFLQFVHPGDKEKVDTAFFASLGKNSVNAIEHRIITPDGIVKFVEERWHIVNNTTGNPLHAIGTIQDISERKNSQRLISESEAKYRALFENSMDGMLLTVTDGEILAANPAACKIFQMTEEEICNAGRFGIVDLSDPRVEMLIKERQLTGKAKGELTLLRKDGSIFPGEISSVLFTDSFGQERTSMIIRDISDRKKAEETLELISSELQFTLNDLTKIMDSSLDVICAVDESGIFKKVSAASEAVWGYKPEELIGKPLFDFVYHEDSEATRQTASQVMNGKSVAYFENRYIRKDGSLVNIEWTARWDEKDKMRYGVARDVTQKKKLQKAFENERTRLNDLFTHAPTSMGILKGANHVFEIVNPPYLDLIGKKDIIGKPVYEVLPEIVEQGFIKILDRVYQTGETFSANEMLVKIDQQGNGELVDKYLNFIYQAYKDVQGNVEGIFFFAVDVTEQVRSRKIIEVSEQRYRTLFEQNLAGVYQSTIKGIILNCNTAFVKMLKYDSIKELLELNAFELYFSSQERNNFITSVIDCKKLYNYEGILKCKDGSPLYVIENISVRKDDATGEDFFDGILIDITERKQAELQLKESNVKYNLISNATHDMVWDYNLITGEVYRNPEGWKKIFGIAKDKEIGTREDWFLRVLPDERQRVKQVFDSIVQSENQVEFEMECRILRYDNTIGYIQDRGYVIRNESGKAIRLIGASHDITERKISEQKILLSEQRFKSLVQNSTDLLTILDAEGKNIYVSPSSKNILGYDPQFLMGKSPFEFIHEDDIQKTSESLTAIASEKYIQVPLFRFKNISGEWRWIESTISYRLDDPAINGIVVNSRDVTGKKIADDEIERLSLIAKETINGVVIIDKHQNILWINNAFAKMCGYELQEVSGKNSLQFLTGPKTDLKVINYIKKQLMGKEPFVFEKLNYTKSGDEIYMRIQVQPIFDEHGDVKQFFALITDITKQKELEEKVELEKGLKQKQITDAVYSAQENERSEIGRELHDNVNQLLGATKLYIDMARTNEKSRDEMLLCASGYTLNAIEEIRKLSKTLITPLIKEIGLADSIKDLTEEIMLVNPIHIFLTAGHLLEDELNDKFKLNIFRIVQEQINNILKHAAAKTININIGDNDGKFLISISDDGIGFDTTTRKAGVGLTNIKSRSQLFNGTLVLSSEPGKGTTLSIAFNKTDILLNLLNKDYS